MRIAVDISLYPLDADYVPPIKDFIERLNRQTGLRVETNAMSTQVSGEHERVFAALQEGGTTTMPLQDTFWAYRWGMLVDRYGKPWMVNCMKPM